MFILEGQLLSGSEWFDSGGKIYRELRHVQEAKKAKEESYKGEHFRYRIREVKKARRTTKQ